MWFRHVAGKSVQVTDSEGRTIFIGFAKSKANHERSVCVTAPSGWKIEGKEWSGEKVRESA